MITPVQQLQPRVEAGRVADTSNWLPAPAAPFRPLMRLYQPRAAILDGNYQIPPITRATSQTSGR